jgi:hypothetical protein
VSNVPQSPGQTQKCHKYRMWPEIGIDFGLNGFSLWERLTAHQVVGGVTAHQADDG